MNLAEKQQQLLEDLLLIEDAQERLSVIVARAGKPPALTPEERTDARRVPGCVSLVWLVPTITDGRCHFRCEADSPVVRGLVQLLCELYSKCPPQEIVAVEPTLIEGLGLPRQLSPTRLNGLRSVRACIRDFAARQLHA
ncbi:MAG: SufE family protein [Candidatus Didemnitutus sp.]|nr:SufE family protein [Candidatus Didemnitutus sp.]